MSKGPSIKDLKSQRQIAQRQRDAVQPMLDDAYDYAIPYRKSARNDPGRNRADKLFDHTAVVSAFRGAGRLQQDLCPPGEPFLRLAPGVAAELVGGKELDALKLQLEPVSKVISALTMDGEWDQAFAEMAIDLMAGTGVMYILEHESEAKARFVTVSTDEVLLRAGPYNDIWGIYWTRAWATSEILSTFADGGPFPEIEKLDKTPGRELDVHQDVTYDAKRKKWCYTAWCSVSGAGADSETVLRRTWSRTCPVLWPRYHKIAGETWGRGPINLAMATIKTLNTAQKITLQAAAIAMLGIYTAVDDGVFNPDNAPLEPGAIWKVKSAGGVLGPSITRFPDPRIDVSNIVLQDLRMSVQTALNDQALPPDGAAVKSATEILERVKRLASDHIGAYGRFVNEIMVPLGKRLIEIAYNQKLIRTRPSIDQLLVKVKVAAPIAEAREASRVQKIIQWLEMIINFAQLAPPDEVAKVTDILSYIGEVLGVDDKFRVSTTEREEIQKQKAEQAAAAAAAAALAAGGGAMTGAAPGGMAA